MKIRLISKEDAKRLQEFYFKNFAHLRKWEPLREDGYHTAEAWERRVTDREKDQEIGCAAYFVMCDTENGEIIGECSLTNIVRGPFQACNMGYSISKEFQGMGYMTEFCSHVIRYAFFEMGLNRIMANYMPSNKRSESLLQRLGFVREGLAKKYLYINGKWEDHILTSMVNPKNT